MWGPQGKAHQGGGTDPFTGLEDLQGYDPCNDVFLGGTGMVSGG